MTQELTNNGRYIARACAAKDVVWRKSPNKGTDGIYVMCTVTQGPCKDTRVPWGPWFSGNAVDRIFESLRYCGCTFPGDDVTNLEGIDRNEVMVVVQADAQEPGGWRVAFVNEIGAAGGVLMDDAAKDDFRSRMKARIMPSGSETQTDQESGSGNGIPF
jgi:hypothetical protein